MSDITGTMPASAQPTATLPAGYTPGAPSSTNNSLNGVNADTFLQLLVSELQNQNPTSPTNPAQFMTQTAQFEQVQELNALQTSIAGLVSAQQASSASSMLGMQVTGSDSSGNKVTGVVTGIQFGPQGPVLSVGNTTMAYSAVTGVSAPGSATTQTTAPTGPAPATTSPSTTTK
jgi:flagellar basal-body rod modification protein FlgD